MKLFDKFFMRASQEAYGYFDVVVPLPKDNKLETLGDWKTIQKWEVDIEDFIRTAIEEKLSREESTRGLL